MGWRIRKVRQIVKSILEKLYKLIWVNKYITNDGIKNNWMEKLLCLIKDGENNIDNGNFVCLLWRHFNVVTAAIYHSF